MTIFSDYCSYVLCDIVLELVDPCIPLCLADELVVHDRLMNPIQYSALNMRIGETLAFLRNQIWMLDAS